MGRREKIRQFRGQARIVETEGVNMMCYGRMNVTGRWPPLPDKFTMVACVCELFVVPREQNIFVRDCAPGTKELIIYVASAYF